MNKIAFIICTNNEQELEECLYYLSLLDVPDGCETEILTITEATSMAGGYNEGMRSSDAKYKVYLHQDVFILNRNIISDILKIFSQDEDIGILGCIGCQKLPDDAYGITSWDIGTILQTSTSVQLEHQDETRQYVEVDAIDGCFIATQYDLPWREDIFDGWDFYDLSQCYEFHRIGKKVVVPYQKAPWCYHGNGYSKMKSYHRYRKLFIEEYQDIFPFSMENEKISLSSQYGSMVERSRKLIEELLDSNKIAQVCELFVYPESRGYLALKEYETLADIYGAELGKEGRKIFREGMNHEDILCQLRRLKYLVKRIEFEIGCEEDNVKSLLNNFSGVAINIIISSYCIKKDEVWKKICRYIDGNCL